VAQLLAGDYSPAGRLPVTFYRSLDDLPAFTDYSMKNRTYRYHQGEVLYPFGHGLSYTRFAYAKPMVTAGANGNRTVSVDVTNSGKMDGEEVVQLYLTRNDIPGQPIRSLVGFKRIALKKGETQTVTFTLDDRRLSTVDDAGVRAVTPGTVDLWIGGGQPVARKGLAQAAGVAVNFTLSGERRVLPK
jgi:beta-glucosidase